MEQVGSAAPEPGAAGPAGSADHGSRNSTVPDFPRIARLELDELLVQLVDRAEEVLASQGRLRGLLAATQAVGSDLSQPAVLRRIVEAARDLVQARHATLRVLRGDADSNEVVRAGSEVDSVGQAAEAGAGVAGTSALRTTLEVPIHAGGELTGTLYLADKLDGSPFTGEDEQVVTALAAAAGIAIENSRLFAAAHRRQRWLEASARITGALLSNPVSDDQLGDSALQLVARSAREVAEADRAVIFLPVGDGDLIVEVVDDRVGVNSVGSSQPVLRGTVFAGRDSLAGAVFAEGKSRLYDHSSHADPAPWQSVEDLGPMMLVPLIAEASSVGVLVLARGPLGAPFRSDELEMAETFAGHAALALELTRAQSDARRLAMMEDRERIARDLHDQVIQRLFATGLGLNGLARYVTGEEGQRRLEGYVRELDATIGAIRTTIFDLQRGSAALSTPSSLRAEVIDVCAAQAEALGFEPRVRFAGPVDALVPEPVVENVLAVLVEALSNTARHAGARGVDVRVKVDPAWLSLRVSDDGRGIGKPGRRSGLANMQRRAELLGGQFSITAGASGRGTSLEWRVPLATEA